MTKFATEIVDNTDGRRPIELDISVLIVTFNTCDLTLRCLEVLKERLKETSLFSEIIIVDNASTDESFERISAQFPDVQIIRNKTNKGFGVANNQAMQLASGRCLLLLNSDAFPEKHAIEVMMSRILSRPKLACVAPQLLNADYSLQSTECAFPSACLAWQNHVPPFRWFAKLRRKRSEHNSSERFLSGAALLVRRDVIARVGLFDEAFFFYYEEADWQRRILNAGFEIELVPEARVLHLQGSSGGKDRLRFTLLAFEGRDKFVLKHSGRIRAVWQRVAIVLWTCTKMMMYFPRLLRSKVRREEPPFPWQVVTRLLWLQFRWPLKYVPAASTARMPSKA